LTHLRHRPAEFADQTCGRIGLIRGSVNLQSKRFDDRGPPGNVFFEQTPEFVGVRIDVRFETSVDEKLLVRLFSQGRARRLSPNGQNQAVKEAPEQIVAQLNGARHRPSDWPGQ